MVSSQVIPYTWRKFESAILAKETSCYSSHVSQLGIPLILPILKMLK